MSLVIASARRRGLLPPRQLTFTSDTLILQDTTGERTVDGARFFTAAKVDGALGEWYGYVSGHDSNAIWLVTADAPEGPWTWRQAVVSGFHTSSPHVDVVDGLFRLYYHTISTNNTQPTLLRTSTDGVSFSAATTVVPATGAIGQWTQHYAQSTSYLRTVRVSGGMVGVFQANNLLRNAQAGASQVTTSVGYATSADGLSWSVNPRPLFGNRPSEIGPFSPSLFRAFGVWYVITTNSTLRVLEVYASTQLTPGSFVHTQTLAFPAGAGWVDSPHVYWHNGQAHIWYGVGDVNATPSTAGIRHAILEMT